MHCTMRNVLFGSLHICETTWRGRPIAPSHVPSPQRAASDVNFIRPQGHGESTWLLRPCAASGDYKRMPLVSFYFLHTTWTLNITRVRHFCTVFAAQAEAMYKPKSSSHCCLLCVRCVKIEEVVNQESDYAVTDEWVKYFDCLSKIDISHDAPYRQRQRYVSAVCMRGVDFSCQSSTSSRQRSTSNSNAFAD